MQSTHIQYIKQNTVCQGTLERRLSHKERFRASVVLCVYQTYPCIPSAEPALGLPPAVILVSTKGGPIGTANRARQVVPSPEGPSSEWLCKLDGPASLCSSLAGRA